MTIRADNCRFSLRLRDLEEHQLHTPQFRSASGATKYAGERQGGQPHSPAYLLWHSGHKLKVTAMSTLVLH
jgi:hypothetical protein